MEKRKWKKPISVAVNVVLSIFIFMILIFVVFAFSANRNEGIPKIFGKSYLTVLSDSMNVKNETYDFNGFKRGDIIVIERYTWVEASAKRFAVGDIITFQDTDDDGNRFYNTHRIIEVNEADKYYITQGDVANSLGYSTNPDDGHAERVYFLDVIGSYQSTIRGLGSLMLFFQTPAGFLIFIVIPLLGLFIIEIFNFRTAFVAYRKDKKGGEPEKTPEELQKEIELLKAELAKKEAQPKE